jgi:hypothetical protein
MRKKIQLKPATETKTEEALKNWKTVTDLLNKYFFTI